MGRVAFLVLISAFTGAAILKATAQEAIPEIHAVWRGVSADTKTIKGSLPGEWIFKEGVISIVRDGKKRDEYTYSIDAKKNSKEIDLMYIKEAAPKGFAGKKIKGIYRIEKDTLIICHVNAEAAEIEKKDRPSSFDTTKRDDVVLLTFERKKQ